MPFKISHKNVLTLQTLFTPSTFLPFGHFKPNKVALPCTIPIFN